MASDTWNGAADWNTSGDWSGGVPNGLTVAEIESGTADVSSSDSEDVSALTVDSGASVTVEGGLVVGDQHVNGVPNDLVVAGSLVVANGGSLDVGGFVTSATGVVTLSGTGFLNWSAGEFDGAATSSGLTVDMAAGGSLYVEEAFDGTITGLDTAGQIYVEQTGGGASSYTINANDTVTLNFSGPTNPYTLAFDTTHNLSVTVSGNEFVITSSTPVCFVAGTRIRTTHGEVAVEDLKVGDEAVTASGEGRPIVWIGSRTIVNPPREQRPVRVMAGAFGENRPARDLWLSPGHAVCLNLIEEVFVPVGEIVNGATIAQVEADEVTYWHVELESHDVLLAEGMPSESYMDAGNRAWFAGGDGAADPERVEASLAAYARPFVNDPAAIETIRRRLAARAERGGWSRGPDMDLHLIVDGARVDPVVEGGTACFSFPARAAQAQIVSRTFSPAWTGESQDQRELGVCLQSLRLSDGLEVSREVPLDGLIGFHPEEAAAGDAWRWTTGQLELPAELWADCRGLALLRLAFDPTAGWSWTAPETAEDAKVVRFRAA